MAQTNTNHFNMMEQLGERFKNTPDLVQLKKGPQWIPLFVYGTLKSGEKNRNFLKGARWLGEARTASIFQVKINFGLFPVMFSAVSARENLNSYHHVSGEVYAVNLRQLIQIDALEDNGVMFQRKENFVYLCEQKVGNINPSIKCWMYMGKRDFWEKHQDSMHLCQHKRMGENRYIYDFDGDREFERSLSFLEKQDKGFFNDHIPF